MVAWLWFPLLVPSSTVARHCSAVSQTRSLTQAMDAEARSAKPSPVLFDDFAETYEEACQHGLALAGESRDYFAAQRITHTARWLEAMGAGSLQRVADFGCGVGHSTPHLQQRFPSARLLGLDI